MKKLLLLLFILAVLFFFFKNKNVKDNVDKSVSPTGSQTSIENSSEENAIRSDLPLQTIIAEGLNTPWAIAFLPEGDMLVTERKGTVRYVNNSGKLQIEPIATISNSQEIGEGGLMGIALHPDYAKATSGRPDFNYVYFYYTYSSQGEDTMNRVVRMKFENNKLGSEEIIVDKIPGNRNHNGGRIKFGPDKNLYITTGDAQKPSLAQDKNSLAGKILRVTDNGQPTTDNPFGNRTYSYGHRNPQGIDWDSSGRLWSTEHGRSGIQSGWDELNLLEAGKNYGWEIIQGDQIRNGMVSPVVHSGSSTWAPAGAAFIGNSLFFGGLRGVTLYEAEINGNSVNIKEHFKGEFGRIREVIKGPDNMLYITTSNLDGRGIPKSGDDKIIRINPNEL